jgi:hypothetical protein
MPSLNVKFLQVQRNERITRIAKTNHPFDGKIKPARTVLYTGAFFVIQCLTDKEAIPVESETE